MSAFSSKPTAAGTSRPNATSTIENIPTSRELGVAVPAPDSKESKSKTERKPWAHFVAGA